MGYKANDYHTFITSANINIDILCISETTQKENCSLKLNISVDGYMQPFILGSKTARGWVAIYVKDNYNVIKRNGINIVDKSFEPKKAKKTMWVCLYTP